MCDLGDDEDYRLAILLCLADVFGRTLDYVEFVTRGLDVNALAILCGNASRLPQYMKSNDSPYASRRASAPSIEIRKFPDSQFE